MANGTTIPQTTRISSMALSASCAGPYASRSRGKHLVGHRASGLGAWAPPPRLAADHDPNLAVVPRDADSSDVGKSTLIVKGDEIHGASLKREKARRGGGKLLSSVYLDATHLKCRLQIAALDSESARIADYIDRPKPGVPLSRTGNTSTCRSQSASTNTQSSFKP